MTRRLQHPHPATLATPEPPVGFPARLNGALVPTVKFVGLAADDSGQDLAEYALLIGLIAIIVIGAVTAFGGGLVAFFNNIVDTLPFGAS